MPRRHQLLKMFLKLLILAQLLLKKPLKLAPPPLIALQLLELPPLKKQAKQAQQPLKVLPMRVPSQLKKPLKLAPPLLIALQVRMPLL
jgi:hypothetical protein